MAIRRQTKRGFWVDEEMSLGGKTPVTKEWAEVRNADIQRL